MTALSKTRADRDLGFRQLYSKHVSFVWRTLARRGVPQCFLEDATQDVFVVVARRMEEFQGRSSIHTWLYAIAERVAMNTRRKSWRHQRKVSALSWVRAHGSSDSCSRQDAQLLLSQLLDTLSKERRMLYLLVEIEGVSIAELARETQTSANTLYARLAAAREQLKEAAAALLADEEGSQ